MERADLLLKVVSGKIILLLEYMRMTQTATDEKPAPSLPPLSPYNSSWSYLSLSERMVSAPSGAVNI